MADHTKIEWTDSTWNVITGCTLVDDGCRNCYAAELAATRLKHHPSRAGLSRRNADGVAKFTGEVRFNEGWLTQPMHWRQPRMIFVCAHGDLFHPDVPDEWIDRVFAVMALCPQHIFQVLTKRPERMRDYMARRDDQGHHPAFTHAVLMALTGRWNTPELHAHDFPDLPNVWLGTSISDQASADQRIPALLDISATVRFVSAEPLLGPVNIKPYLPGCYECAESCGERVAVYPALERCSECGRECDETTLPKFSEGCPKCGGYLEPICPSCDGLMVTDHPDTPCLDQVIVGGESGRNARPMHPDWARGLRDQCVAAGVPFFFKQWGEWLHCTQDPYGHWDWADADKRNILHHWEDGTSSVPLKKKAAGRLLDGREWSEVPAHKSSGCDPETDGNRE